MTQTADRDRLSHLVGVIHEALEQKGLTSERCLFATTILIDLAVRIGFESYRWEGSAIWYNRKYIEIKNSGYDFKGLAKLPPEKREKRLQALEKKGMRSIHCLANEGDLNVDLGGHLCVVASKNGHSYFIDPTCHQFKRTPKLPELPGSILAPKYIVSIIDHTTTPEINFLHPYNGGMGVYLHEPVNRYRQMMALPETERADTDLNPRRHPDLDEYLLHLLKIT